jgi:outer membrane usher protein
MAGSHASDGYADVASLYGGGARGATGNMRGQVGMQAGKLGVISLGYLTMRDTHLGDSRYANLSWSKAMSLKMNLNLTFNRNLLDSVKSSVGLLASFTLGHRMSASSSYQHTDRGGLLQASAQQQLPTEGGIGWRASAIGGATQGGQGGLDYSGRYTEASVGASAYGGATSAYADASGSVVFMGGSMFAGRRIDGGFAVVSTDGVPNVPVTHENNVIGTTDSRGMLLVPQLNAYQDNKIGIDPLSLPPDMRFGGTRMVATPSDRAGTLVRFEVRQVRAAMLTLLEKNGKPVPVGSMVRQRATKMKPAMVGFDGALYLEELDAHNVLDITRPGGAVCHVVFDYQRSTDGMPQNATLTCK